MEILTVVEKNAKKNPNVQQVKGSKKPNRELRSH